MLARKAPASTRSGPDGQFSSAASEIEGEFCSWVGGRRCATKNRSLLRPNFVHPHFFASSPLTSEIRNALRARH